jgi:hypothetical protein
MFTFALTKDGKVVAGRQADPVYVRLKLAAPSNRTNLQCAMWKPSSDG